jgi:ATP-grasp in the biosynthetic pathway with Ter operon
VADLRRYLERRPCAMLVPGSDFALFAVSQRRQALEDLTQLGLPSHEVVKRGFNREVLAAAAGIAGLSPAAAVRCGTVDEAVAAASRLGYPVLMKSISTVRDLGAVVAAGPGTRRIADEAELRQAVKFYGNAWLVQQLSNGRTLSFGGVMAGDRLVGVAVSRYLRTWPPQAGNVSFSVTIEPSPGLETAVEALLKEIGWEGIFELELIEDDHGSITPIDLNPRPYGSMSLAIAAGANLPAIWCDWVLGRDRRLTPYHVNGGPPGVTSDAPAQAVAVAASGAPAQEAVSAPGLMSVPDSVSVAALAPVPDRAASGRHYRWEDADMRHFMWQLRRGHWRTAMAVLRPYPGVVHAYFRIGDPLPFVARTVSLMLGKIRARLIAR